MYFNGEIRRPFDLGKLPKVIVKLCFSRLGAFSVEEINLGLDCRSSFLLGTLLFIYITALSDYLRHSW